VSVLNLAAQSGSQKEKVKVLTKVELRDKW
jgi:hypothetical protein